MPSTRPRPSNLQGVNHGTLDNTLQCAACELACASRRHASLCSFHKNMSMRLSCGLGRDVCNQGTV